MVIDFHTHIFPDKIAQKTIEILSERSKLKAHTDGTLNGLIQSMEACGVDYSVVLPIATKPSQADTINTYAAQITEKKGIISFGSVHPFSENWRAELDRISSLGLKGIKLHPDYQDFFIDDERIFPVIEYANRLGLIIVFHSGVDIGLPGDVRCPPCKARKMIDAVGGGKLVFAHTGGFRLWSEAEEFLAGQDIYFDISCTLSELSNKGFLSIIKAHGADKCLFGTDSPWSSQSDDINVLKNTGLSTSELEDILYNNAAKLLEIGG